LFLFGEGDFSIAAVYIFTDRLSDLDSTLVEYYLQQKYQHFTWSGSIPASDTQAIIHFPSLPGKKVGDADFAPGATSNSPATIVYTSSNPLVATIVGGNIHITGSGSVLITASQAATTGYTAATSVSQALTVEIPSSVTVQSEVFIIPNLNPIKFYLPSPDTTYDSRDIDDFEFFDSIPEWEEQVDYYQPWNKEDKTTLQLLSDFGPHNFVIKDLGGTVILTIPFTQIAQSEDIPGLWIYECKIDMNILDEGQYRFYLESGH
jgi:hypothetical protein